MKQHKSGMVAWFAENHVAANLLMMLILLLGIFSAITIKKRMFPEFEVDSVKVQVVYPGASPVDIEKGINIKIEESLNGIVGIKKVRSYAAESLATVFIDVENGFDVDAILDEVKQEVEAITNWPEDAEKPLVSRLVFSQPVIWLSIYGNVSDFTLHELAKQYRDELIALPEIKKVSIAGGENLVIAIEISEFTLREYQLTFSEIAQAIRGSSIDLSAGSIETDGGNILLRTRGQAWNPQDFKNIVLRDFLDGTQLKLMDVADVKEMFEDDDGYSRFNGKPAVSLSVSSEGVDSDIEAADALKQWVEDKRATNLPSGIYLDHWGDVSFYLKGRLNMMLENMAIGAFLVFILLSFFLRVRIAFWVMVGLPVSFLGAIAMMPVGPLPVTINIVSLFAFILVLGIIVDDAIIISESVYTEIGERGHTLSNVVKGVEKVIVPASFGVLTTIAAFAPILTVGGQTGPFFEAIAVVVIWCLIFSLIESKFILPSHLVQMKGLDHQQPARHGFTRLQNRFDRWLKRFIDERYLPFLQFALKARYVTLSFFVALMLVTVGALKSDLIKFVLFPEVPSDFIEVEMEMNSGVSSAERNRNLTFILDALYQIDLEYKQARQDQQQNQQNRERQEDKDSEESELGIIKQSLIFDSGDTSGQMVVEMTKAENRTLDAYQIVDLWRDRVGQLAGVKRLEFKAGANVGGSKPINFRLNGDNYEQLQALSYDLTQAMKAMAHVKDVENDFKPGVDEIILTLLPSASSLGVDLQILGRQVRQGFYGEEVERFQRGNDEIKVLLRYPESERRDLGDLEKIRVRTADGSEVPLGDVAKLERGQGYSTIKRIDGSRSISVSADVNTAFVEPTEVIETIKTEVLPELLKKYPDVTYVLDGASEEEEKTKRNMARALVIALFLIYALIAIPLKSYVQPFIIMSIIPFGLIGAVFGHILLGLNLSMLSIYGLIALSGVLVNDSLILVDFVNRSRDQGYTTLKAVLVAGRLRFRAILLTSLTTFFGLIPILLEKSLQAQFVIPMATSLGFGILFATAITLFLIPTLYLVLDDFAKAKRWYQSLSLATRWHSELIIFFTSLALFVLLYFTLIGPPSWLPTS